MTDKIVSQEIFVREGGAVIRTRCQKKFVTDTMVARQAQYQRMDVGDQLVIQCMNHELDTIYWQRTYLVASRRDFLQRTENADGDVRTAEAFEVRVLPMGDWLVVSPDPEEVDDTMGVKWNVGAQKYEVVKSGNVVFADANKAAAEAFVASGA